MKTHSLLVFAIAIGWTFLSEPGGRHAHAEESRKVTVTGNATVSAAPTHVQVNGTIRGAGESGAAAHEAYRKIKSKVEKTFAESDDKDLKLRFEGEKLSTATSYDEALGFPDGGGEVADTQFEVIEPITLKLEIGSEMARLQIARQVASLIDDAKEAGVEFVENPNPYGFVMQETPAIVQFTIDDPANLQTKAYAAAIADARTRGGRLAELAGGRLGKVLSIEELKFETDDNAAMNAMLQFYGDLAQPDGLKLSSYQNKKIEVRQKLRVVFELID